MTSCALCCSSAWLVVLPRWSESLCRLIDSAKSPYANIVGSLVKLSSDAGDRQYFCKEDLCLIQCVTGHGLSEWFMKIFVRIVFRYQLLGVHISGVSVGAFQILVKWKCRICKVICTYICNFYKIFEVTGKIRKIKKFPDECPEAHCCECLEKFGLEPYGAELPRWSEWLSVIDSATQQNHHMQI